VENALRRRGRVVRALTCVLVLASTLTALAEPPPAPRANSSNATRTGRRPVPAATGSHNADTSAYPAGKQPLLGWHALPADPLPPRDAAGRPMLALRGLNRGEFLAIPASSDDGGFDSLDLDRAAHLLRAMSGDEYPVDPRTLALVYQIQTHFAAPEIRVVSGYRVPRPRSHSNHGKGRAIDFIVPGTADEDVAKFAREMGFVGVGIYPRSQFVHVDIRPRSYFWVDSSGPHMKNRERGILGDLASRGDASAVARGQAPIEPFGLATDVDTALRHLGVASTVPSEDEDDDDEN
jgi:uncharacterized protein YcbK (DUF882 family)